MTSLPKRLSLSSLVVSEENYRFDPQMNEVLAIEMLLYELDDKQLRLAQDILANGLSPNEFPLVLKIQDNPAKYRVLEGNRRISVLKLMKSPGIIKDPDLKSKYEQKFRALGRQMQKELNRPYCVIVEAKEDADPWIHKKHATGLKGEGTERWEAESVERYDIEVGNKTPSIGYLAFRYLRKNEKITESRGGFSLTTFSRILQNRHVQEVIGISAENGDLVFLEKEDVVILRLNKLIQSFPTRRRGRDGITSRSVNTSDDIVQLIDHMFGISEEENDPQPQDQSPDKPEESTNCGREKENKPQANNATPNPSQQEGETPTKPAPESAQRGQGTRRSLPEFFDDLDNGKLDGKNPDHRALKNVTEELISVSKKYILYGAGKRKVYEAYPVATAALMRTALEQSLILLLKKKGQWVSLEQRKNGDFIMLNDLTKHIGTLDKRLLFSAKRDEGVYEMVLGSACVQSLNRYIHNPSTTRPTPEALKSIAASGLFDLISYVLNLP